MAHFASMCCSSPLKPQVIFYYGHVSHFYYWALNILFRHNIQYFILKAGDYVYDQLNDNGPNMNLRNIYGSARMNWMRHHGILKFTPPILILSLLKHGKLSNYHLKQ